MSFYRVQGQCHFIEFKDHKFLSLFRLEYLPTNFVLISKSIFIS